MSSNWQPQAPVEQVNVSPVEGGSDGAKALESENHGRLRKKVVVVGLGMVGVSFM
jgi:hypothetical protein